MRSAFATPDLMLWTESGEFIISVMIGGLGTLVGPIIGGAFFTILRDKVSSVVDWYFIVIGGVLVYKDATHLTGLYARTLGPYLARMIDASG